MTSTKTVGLIGDVRLSIEALRKQIIWSPTKEQFYKYKARFNYLTRQFNSILMSLRGEFVIVDEESND
jgi:hypothetical protein